MAKPAHPQSNEFDADMLRSYIAACEGYEDDIASEMGSAMARVKKLREQIKETIADAKETGVPMKALKAELKLRKLDRDKNKVVAGLDQDDRESLDAIQAALGDYASTPLGASAMMRASN